MQSDLQKQIQKGARLKKTVTNDRSGPVLDSGSSKSGSGPMRPPGGPPRPPTSSSLNSSLNSSTSSQPSSAPQLGGLFAGGMPKLKSTSGAARDDTPTAPPSLPSRNNNSNNNNNFTSSNKFSVPSPPSQRKVSPNLPRKEYGSPKPPPPPPARKQPPPPPARNAPPPPPARAPKPPAPPRGNTSPPGVKKSISTGRFDISPRSSVGPSYEDDGRWSFRTDLPTPRQFPSGMPYGSHDSGGGGRPSATRRPAPPPPPPRR